MFQYLHQQAQESPYGPETEPEKAPEAISRSVASLPPEQMFELMKQMKQCVHNNPNEAKNLLMNNPQLAYALLQVCPFSCYRYVESQSFGIYNVYCIIRKVYMQRVLKKRRKKK